MNLTQIIEQTGKRLRMGKPPTERLTNAQVKEVLEAALDIMKQALKDEGRIEIQGFLVIERTETPVKAGGKLKPFGAETMTPTGTIRRGWRVRVRE